MKKLITVLLSVFMLFSFACCSAKEQPQTTQSETVLSSAAETQTLAEETENRQDNSAGSFRVGLVMSEDKRGEAIKKGAQLAVDKINASGGIQLELITASFNDTVTADSAYESLKNSGMQILIGSCDETLDDALLTKSNTDRIFHVSLTDAPETSVFSRDNVIRLHNGQYTEGRRIADYISAKLPAEKAGIIYQSDSKSSEQLCEQFLESAELTGIEIASAESFDKNNGWDFSSQLVKSQSKGTQVLVLPVKADKAALIIEQAGAIGYKPVFVGCEELKGLLSVKGINRKYIDDVMIVTDFSLRANGNKNTDFVSLYKTVYKESPVLYSAYGYDAVNIIYEHLLSSGVKKYSTDSEKICKKFISERNEFVFSGVSGENMIWDKDGNLSSVSPCVIIEKGKYVG